MYVKSGELSDRSYAIFRKKAHTHKKLVADTHAVRLQRISFGPLGTLKSAISSVNGHTPINA